MPEPVGEKTEVQDKGRQAATVETASPPTRRYRSFLFQLMLFLAIGVFALLTFLVETTPSFPIDLRITQSIQSVDSPVFAGLMKIISWPGFLPQSMIITLLVALVLHTYRLQWEAFTSLLAALFSGVINEFVKGIIRRPRPSGDLVDVFAELRSFSFPSGHVMFYMALFGFIGYLTFTLMKQSLLRSLLLGFLGGFILLVGVSRIYLGQHWASDVLGAYLLGGLLLAGIVLLYQWGKKRFYNHQPAVPTSSEKD